MDGFRLSADHWFENGFPKLLNMTTFNPFNFFSLWRQKQLAR